MVNLGLAGPGAERRPRRRHRARRARQPGRLVGRRGPAGPGPRSELHRVVELELAIVLALEPHPQPSSSRALGMSRISVMPTSRHTPGCARSRRTPPPPPPRSPVHGPGRRRQRHPQAGRSLPSGWRRCGPMWPSGTSSPASAIASWIHSPTPANELDHHLLRDASDRSSDSGSSPASGPPPGHAGFTAGSAPGSTARRRRRPRAPPARQRIAGADSGGCRGRGRGRRARAPAARPAASPHEDAAVGLLES